MKKHVVITLIWAFCMHDMLLAQTNSDQQSGRPISSFLNEDGTFSNPDGYSGAVDLAGFQMGMNDGGMPVFFNADDDNWTLQIYDSGTNNTIHAMVIVGNDIYIGGQFSTAGGVAASHIARYDMIDKSWHPLGSGVGNTVFSLAVSGSDLYVGGTFITAGGVLGRVYIARYDLSTDLGDDSWHPLGSGVGGNVYALAVAGTDLYVGGEFITAGEATATRIARYDMATDDGDASWHALGSGVNSTVNALAVSGTDLYVGGDFGTAGGKAASRIARYDMSTDDGDDSWYTLGNGVNQTVNALTVSGSDLYVGGNFTTAGNIAGRNRIARYDMTAGDDNSGWHKLGNGVAGQVNALAVSGTNLYVGGNFTTAGGIPGRNRIARYDLTIGDDNAGWFALGSGTGEVNTLVVSGTDLYVGGNFTSAGGVSGRDYIAYYDILSNSGNDSWYSLSNNIDNTVRALAVWGNDLYMGGDFVMAGGVGSSRIARYNMTSQTWHSLGNGVNGAVNTLAISGNDLYVGGSFTNAGGVAARNRIARYDMATNMGNDSWHPLGNGVGNAVYALAISGNDLYVGGFFTTAGGVADRNRIARYDMTTSGLDNTGWHDLGEGLDNYVLSLAVSGSDLYVGGSFTTAGGVGSRNFIARYDMASDEGNDSWSALGSGLNDFVYALAVSGNDLYVGGNFTTAGNVAGRNRIARYDLAHNDGNSSWYPLGSGVNGPVYALAVAGTDLYVGGSFTTAGGDANRNRIARYNMATNDGNNSWSAFGSGLNDLSFALAVSGTDLYVGGFFNQAGGKPAHRLGRWSGLNPAPSAITLLTPLHNSSDNLPATTFTWSADDYATSYQLQITTISNFSSLTRDISNILTTEYTLTEVQSLDYNQGYFWRVRGIGDGGEGPWSVGERGFSIIPGPVTLVAPDDESTISPINVEFEWELDNSIYTYNLEISKVDDFSDSPIQRIINVPITKSIAEIDVIDTHTYTLDVYLDYSTTYYWRIQGVNNADVEGAWSDAHSFTTIVAAPEQVTLVSPAALAGSIPIRPEYTWNEALRATGYQLRVSTNSDMSDPIINAFYGEDQGKIVSDPSQSDAETWSETPEVDLAYNTTYYWQVRGFNDGGASEWSDTRSFLTINEIPAKVDLSLPQNNINNLTVRPEFKWSPATRAWYYRFQLATDVDFNDIVINQQIGGEVKMVGDAATIEEITFTPESDLLNDTQYFWRVRADNDGGQGAWSDTWQFRTEWPVPPVIVLLTPDQGATHQPLRPTLTWEDQPYSHWYLLEIYDNETYSGTPVYTKDEIFSGFGDAKTVGAEETVTTINEVEYTISEDLENGTQYFWRVRGRNNTGNGDWSASRNFTTIVAASDQVSLVSPAVGAVSIPLRPEYTWNEAIGATGYQLQVSVNSDMSDPLINELYGVIPLKMVSDVSEASTWSETPEVDLDFNTTYYWQVRGWNDGGSGDWSDTWSFTTIVGTPDVITIVSPVEALGVAILTAFSWEPDALATSYDLELSATSGFTTILRSYPGIAGTDFTLTEALQYDTNYFWRVRGTNASGEGPWSESPYFTTMASPVPYQPTVFFPTNGQQNIFPRPEFSWEDLGEGITYDLDVSQNSDYTDPVISMQELTEPFFIPDFNLLTSTEYFWRVRAINEFGAGLWNDGFMFTTLDPTIPDQITGLTIEQLELLGKELSPGLIQTTSGFRLSWNAPEWDGGSPITHYTIIYRTEGESGWTVYEREPSTETSADVTGFTTGERYAFDVLAVNAVGSSVPTEEFFFVTSIESEDLPDKIVLQQNYPNPFNPSTTIRYALPHAVPVTLEVYSTLGQRMMTIQPGVQSAGWYTVTIDGSNLSSGVYIYRLQAGDVTMTKKFMLVK